MTKAQAYPLAWPQGIARHKASWRERSQFRVNLQGALDNVRNSLRLFGKDSGHDVADVVISSNCSLGEDTPSDPGIAVWFMWDKRQVCIPIDRYSTPAANLQAIHHVLEARRVEARHGTVQMVRQSFAGFLALPAPRHWSDVLGVSLTADRTAIESAFRERAKEAHPDRPNGSEAAMAELNQAREAALEGR